ncbi:uncharacterized protein F4807DRAFT_419837 [Annulohypoxylon truncatum]|uniref:uncharacterized protein n=1 Tax=Annulohypoxylon truncatum TaxID=327061 RepID=UPI002008E943|nr:uncharacterized protein F4807DRAFT_419837 [Annulohypoxylon truncatum]KAI1211311.1 hypothetical protein F4807DRAFT_419837 [Annulohypoxylon truncatum]
MPQDPNLYGQRPAKRQKKEIPLSSSLDFASQLTSLLSTSASDPTSASSPSVAAGRARPSKNKDDIFSVKAKRKPGSAAADGGKGSREHADRDRDAAKLSLKDPRGTEDEKQDLARARRRMEEKARLYAAMKRGDYIAKEGEAAPLVDFDRKWAEKHPEDDPNNANNYSSSGTDDSDSEAGKEEEGGEEQLIEFKDEFGRTRRATRAEIARLQRRRQRVELSTAELEAMAAKPIKAPTNLIFGDVIQSAAFDPEAETYARMEDLAAKRDRSPTPPPDAHFDGGAEIRTKGVGFYNFSREEERRREEMAALERERANTERVRREREEAREKRRREIEERRARIGAKRAEKMADSFLDGLAEKWGATTGGGGAAAASGPGGEGKEVEDGGKEKEKDSS